MYFVYLLECKDSSLYTGITTDVVRRFAEHKSGTGARYTRARAVKRIRYVEEQPDRARASRREAAIKRMSRAQKLELIRSMKSRRLTRA